MKKLISILLLAFQLLICQQSHAATNSDYSCKPPYLSQLAKPNINLVLDYSGSMNWLAYVSCDGSTCTAYDSTSDYFGYFKSDSYYKYNSSGYWEENSSCSTTNRMGAITASASTGCLSGNILNYATSSRINTLRKILTGGRFDTSSSIYTDEGSDASFTDSQTNCKFTIATPSATTRTIKIENNTGSTATLTGVNITVSSAAKTFTVPRRSSFNGFAIGDIITTTGFTNSGNNGVFKITSISRNQRTITCSAASGLANETSATSAKVTTGTSGTCVLLGGASSSNTYKINNKTTTPADATGVLQGLYPEKVDLEMSFFSGNMGVTYVTGKNKLLSDYVSAINTTSPNGGTNTGPALADAKNYFTQASMTQSSSSINSANNALMISKTDAAKDPFYDIDSPSTLPALPAPCRKSFVLLISDGQWNSGVDPVIPAYYMHMNDLRTDAALPGSQDVTTYTVYAFGDGDEGRNALINTAMWGGFNDSDGNNAPYPFTAVSSANKTSGSYNPFGTGNSLGYPSATTTFPISECDPAGTWTTPCSEWDTKKSGLPYNFFEASDGAELKSKIEDAVLNILGNASSSTAASVMGNNDNSGSTLLQAMYYPERMFKENDLNTKATWIGELQGFWYYIDPSLNNVTIREDSDNDLKLNLSKDQIAEFTFVNTDTMTIDMGKVKDQTVIKLYADANGDGVKDTPATPSATIGDPTKAKALWQAGKSLWAINDPSKRNIFTSDPSKTTATKMDFGSANASSLFTYMDTADSTTAAAVIEYVRGSDVGTTYRNRTVTIGTTSNVWRLGDIINSTPKIQSEVRLNSYNLRQPGGYSDTSYDQYTKSNDYNQRGVAYVGANDGMLHAFKLGSNFDGSQKDVVAEIKNADKSAATGLGGELWAFIPKNTLPYLQYLRLATYQHLYMVDATPLLVDASINPTRYTKGTATITCTDATYSQCVKKTTVSASTGQLSYDATSGTSWRTLLLGSTGMGGAASPVRAETTGIPIKVSGTTFTRTSGSFSTDGFAVGTIFAASGFTNPKNNTAGFTNTGTNTYFTVSSISSTVLTCSAASGLVTETSPTSAKLQQITVKTPRMDPVDTTKGFGYSSAFALDVTDSLNPQLLWEFSDPRLGFTTATPAIVRIKDATDTGSGPQRNGKWFAVYASGPSGPINNSWFMGITDKKLTIFVLDLKSGQLVRTFSSAAPSSTNTQFTLPVDAPAFAGSLSGATTDTDKFDTTRAGAYSDDAIYIGYTRANNATAPTAWDKGGVLRLLTYNDPDPANWKISTLIDGVGPVTSAVTKLQDATKSQLWLYFGTGRYYTKDDDPTNVQSLFGLKDPCFITSNKFAPTCNTDSFYAAPTVSAATSTAGATFTGLVNQTNSVGTVAASDKGWKIDLGAASGSNYPKRVITDTLASTSGVVTFTTFTPSKDVCSYGGSTSVWAVKHDTGGSGAAKLKGQLLMQLSTGAFEQVDFSKAFTENSLRETGTYKGVPPATPPSITANTNHFPTKRFLHIQER